MALNFVQTGENLDLVIGSAFLSGDPVLVGTALTGVALTDGSASVKTVIATKGVYNLPVKGINGSGNSAVAVGDALYYVTGDTPVLSKKATGVLFGYALEPVTSSSTSTIAVRLTNG